MRRFIPRVIVLSPYCNWMRATCDSGMSAPVLDVSTRLPIASGLLRTLRRKADRRVIAPLADEDLADGAAADAGLDQVGNIGDIDAVARRGLAIDLDRDLGQRRLLIDARTSLVPRTLLENARRSRLPMRRSSLKSSPKIFDDQLAVRRRRSCRSRCR